MHSFMGILAKAYYAKYTITNYAIDKQWVWTNISDIVKNIFIQFRIATFK